MLRRVARRHRGSALQQAPYITVTESCSIAGNRPAPDRTALLRIVQENAALGIIVLNAVMHNASLGAIARKDAESARHTLVMPVIVPGIIPETVPNHT